VKRADVVDWLTEEPARTGLFTDFDGTLSAIVKDPGEARPLPGAVEILHALAGRLAVVAVVSGRPAGFLGEVLALPAAGGRLHVYGLHGLEHTTGSGIDIAEPVTLWADRLRAAWRRLAEGAPPGLDLEDKGFGLTVHWREAADPTIAAAGRMLAEKVAAEQGLVVRPGRASAELVPPVGIDKGSVVREWATRLTSPRLAFLGDDVSDELAFRALTELEANGAADVLRVAVDSTEAPKALLDAADARLDGPEEAVTVLGETLQGLGTERR
jgi:trehalose 6-phosphate phosphatase